MRTRYLPWGLYPQFDQKAVRLQGRSKGLPVQQPPKRTFLPFGNGRSYGDSCLNRGGLLLDARGLDRFIEFDSKKGVLTCESGVLLSEIIRLVVPDGWFLPVVPGTQWVTVGGAIANDVHGKNHARAGTFGCHVLGFELLRSDGTRMWCSPSENQQWFGATIGGMGLTGLILRAKIVLKRIFNAAMEVETIPFTGLDEFFDVAAQFDARFEYIAAWVDCISRGKSGLRGLLIAGKHADRHISEPPPRYSRVKIPAQLPISVVNRASTRLFNTVHFHRGQTKTRREIVRFEPFFFPLDGIESWNRLYGPRGFFQHQCVIPFSAGETIVREIIATARRFNTYPSLAVLKLFGSRPSPGLMSFPKPGVTLTLDFANRGHNTFRMLDALDHLVKMSGGRVNPYKDARMSSAFFKTCYPKWEDLERRRDPNFTSSFWRRTARE